ncbi:MAG: APC family permease, partial [Candidatus Dormibacteria bacterium]
MATETRPVEAGPSAAGGTGGMRQTLSLTGVTVNAMALIAPGAFLWTTFQSQAGQSVGGVSTASDMWIGLAFALILAFLTAYSYSELANRYPRAGTGSSYYFAEAALLDKEKAHHRSLARMAKFSVGWLAHLYYWIYPGIMAAFGGILFGYLYSIASGHSPSTGLLIGVVLIFTLLNTYVAFRGISGSTMTAIVINVIQLVALVSFALFAIVFRVTHPGLHYDNTIGSVLTGNHSFTGILGQGTIAILLLVGFESITSLGAEAKNPKKDIRRGILLSLAIQGLVMYMFE